MKKGEKHIEMGIVPDRQETEKVENNEGDRIIEMRKNECMRRVKGGESE